MPPDTEISRHPGGTRVSPVGVEASVLAITQTFTAGAQHMRSTSTAHSDSTITSTTRTTGCIELSSVFQHRLVEEPPTSAAPAEDRREYQGLMRQARAACEECPLLSQCLYSAVVEYDVAGICAGTTRKQRIEIRNLLKITVEPEDLDTLAGVQARHRQVDHHEIVRLRNANPHESLETIAHRLGCSLSTVKRHLRKARSGSNVTPIDRKPAPTMTQVMQAFRTVVLRAAQRPAA